jgi:energy-coupling factor transport system substrate-specific component
MNLLKNYRIYDLVVIALMAALGLATKTIVTPLSHVISGPLNMPGGALAGGLYMFWIVLAGALVNKRGSATLTALVQALMVIVIGSVGSHGIMSVVTYTMPGLMIDLVFLLLRRDIKTNIDFFIGGMIANMTGTFLTGMVFFRLPAITMVMIVASGMLSGGLGGLIAYATYKGVKQIENMGQDNGEASNVKKKKSYKGIILFISILAIIGLVYVFSGFGNISQTDDVFANAISDDSLILDSAQPLLITGDVINGGYLENYQDLLEFEYYKENDSTDFRIETTTLLNTLELCSSDNKIYLIGSDGFMVGIDGDTLSDTYVAYNHENGWMFISDKHPVNSGIKHMSEIVIVSQIQLEDFNIIKDENNNFYSYGKMRMMMTDIIQVLDGVSKLDDIELDVGNDREAHILVPLTAINFEILPLVIQ